MSLPDGTSLGPYRVDYRLDAGGMGEVFRGTDTRLNRTVAIKVLAANRVAGTEFQRRFELEARAVSSLNHPNICILFDVGRQEDVDYLVMEYLEGETLRAVLARGPMAVNEALRYGAQILSALDHAHRRGIVHRDLKPGNIMLVGPESKRIAKLLDFGLAHSTPQSTRSSNPQEASTELAITLPGDILGTPQYMAPEVLQHKPADARSDLHAFGAILYEMLTGIKAFEGDSQAHVLAAVLRDTPPAISKRLPGVPPPIEAIVSRCLAKNPDDRWQTASDLVAALQISGAASASQTETSRPSRLPWILAATASITALGLLAAMLMLRPSKPSGSIVRTTIVSPDGFHFVQRACAAAPNGKALACVVLPATGGLPRLWLRPLDARSPQTLQGTEGASGPFWSPDNRFVGFFAQGKLKKINLDNGIVQELCNAAVDLGASWSPSGEIVFAPHNRTTLHRVSSNGGAPVSITSLDTSRGENSHRSPQFLPDGRHFLFTARSSFADNTTVNVGSLDSKDVRRLFAAQSNAAFVDPDYLLFVRQGTLFFQRFNKSSLALEGNAEPVPGPGTVGQQTASASAYFSASANAGLLAYQSPDTNASQLTWFDRSGHVQANVGSESSGNLIQPRISPDGKQAVVVLPDKETGNRDLYLLSLTTGVLTRFTTNPANDWFPVWSPDGTTIAFASDRTVPASICRKPVNGESTEVTLFKYPGNVTDWSTDGQLLVGTEVESIVAYPLTADGKPYTILSSPGFPVQTPRLSPDGKWLAFESTEAGEYNVYVTSITNGGKRRISPAGGGMPVWRKDGRELFYSAPDNTIMAMDITTGASFDTGPTRALFRACPSSHSLRGSEHNYDVSADGQRFLISCNTAPPGVSTINVDLGWVAALDRSGR